VQLSAVTVLLSIALAVLIALLICRYKKLSQLVLQGFGMIYSIPSLALFALLIPVSGLGMKTALIVLVAYNQYLLLRSILAGLSQVDPSITEAAAGMGMPKNQIFWKVQIPLALPMIMTGVRLAIISTIGIGTIAATINAGGLGAILFDGLRTMNQYKIVIGTLLCALLALGANVVLRLVEMQIARRMHTGGAQISFKEALQKLFKQNGIAVSAKEGEKALF
jgi:osmoprotectant transport system permease protein